jgi:hypothetical protein
VRVKLLGIPVGVKTSGGILDQVLREVEIECLPGRHSQPHRCGREQPGDARRAARQRSAHSDKIKYLNCRRCDRGPRGLDPRRSAAAPRLKPQRSRCAAATQPSRKWPRRASRKRAKAAEEGGAKKPEAGEEVSLGRSKSGQPGVLAGIRRRRRRPVSLVVGLGNPGPEYLWTPHNAGFMAIDRIAQQEGVVVQNRRCRAVTATCRIAGREVVLAKPETFMNLSGLAVAALVRSLKRTRRRICS